MDDFECHILRSLIAALKISRHTRLIDIGGNIGMYSLHHAASLGRNSVTIDLFCKNHESFCQSILHNPGFTDKIKLVQAALTNDKSKKYVDFDKSMFERAVYSQGKGQKNYGLMMVNGQFDKPPDGDLGKDYAMAVTLDSLQERKTDLLPPPGSHVVLKVDVEGSECKALIGGIDYLSKVRIDYVAMEWSAFDRINECSTEEDGVTLEKSLVYLKRMGWMDTSFTTFVPNGSK
mmetsp:Transcript_16628/g.31495  ORF Transcript_16628/g.31495 Transcript_16628/m.31495 type:complete len:233 (+) Transcript_16628:271-969(+)